MSPRYQILITRAGRTAICGHGPHIVGVFLGQTAEADLLAAFPDAVPAAEGDPLLEAAGYAVHRGAPPVPLALTGTPFQRAVWKALTRTPWGQTITYKDLAAEAGYPGAWRAAAAACAANRIAILVPCHRAVRGNGGAGGYRWGEDLKAALLEQEAAGPPPFSG